MNNFISSVNVDDVQNSMQIIDLYQRGNENFMSQLTLIFIGFGFIVTILSVVIPLYQYISYTRSIREINKNMDYIRGETKYQVEELKKTLELEFSQQLNEVNEKLNDFTSFLEEHKYNINKKATEVSKHLDLYKNPKWIEAHNESDKLKAIDIYNQLILQYPDEINVYRQLGIIYYFDIRDFSKAVEMFLKILELDKYNPYALLMAGKSYENLKRYTDAEHFFIRASQKSINQIIDLSQFYIRQNKYYNALEVLKGSESINILSSSNMYKPGYLLKSLIYCLNGQYDNAKENLLISEVNLQQIHNFMKESDIDEDIINEFIDFSKTVLEY